MRKADDILSPAGYRASQNASWTQDDQTQRQQYPFISVTAPLPLPSEEQQKWMRKGIEDYKQKAEQNINTQLWPNVNIPKPPIGEENNWYKKVEDRQAAKVPPKAATYDEGKEPLAWLPWGGIDEVAKAQAHGHKKYKDFNNYRKGLEVSRNLSCAIRHIRDFMEGLDQDHESGLNPLGHAACRLLFVLQNLKDGTAIDDRYRPANTPVSGRGLVDMAPVKSKDQEVGLVG